MKYFSSSERKGILLVAAIALMVSLTGFLVSRCDSRQPALSPLEAEVMLRPDTAASDTVRKKRKGGKRGRKSAEKKRKDAKKSGVKRRDPLDSKETVSTHP